jgi:hypothetical protein
MKQKWSEEGSTDCLCTINVRNGTAWLKVGIWKLREMRRRFEKG